MPEAPRFLRPVTAPTADVGLAITFEKPLPAGLRPRACALHRGIYDVWLAQCCQEQCHPDLSCPDR